MPSTLRYVDEIIDRQWDGMNDDQREHRPVDPAAQPSQ